MKKHDYLERILNARVYDVAIETPLDLAPNLTRRLGNHLWLKREDMQPVFSFKLRGAYNKMARLPQAVLKRGVIAASAGNHAQGAKVILHGDSYDEAYGHAREIEATKGLTFVHPYDDPDVIAGQGTIGMEILRQHTRPIHAIFVPIGGGGLLPGLPS